MSQPADYPLSVRLEIVRRRLETVLKRAADIATTSYPDFLELEDSVRKLSERLRLLAIDAEQLQQACLDGAEQVQRLFDGAAHLLSSITSILNNRRAEIRRLCSPNLPTDLTEADVMCFVCHSIVSEAAGEEPSPELDPCVVVATFLNTCDPFLLSTDFLSDVESILGTTSFHSLMSQRWNLFFANITPFSDPQEAADYVAHFCHNLHQLQPPPNASAAVGAFATFLSSDISSSVRSPGSVGFLSLLTEWRSLCTAIRPHLLPQDREKLCRFHGCLPVDAFLKLQISILSQMPIDQALSRADLLTDIGIDITDNLISYLLENVSENGSFDTSLMDYILLNRLSEFPKFASEVSGLYDVIIDRVSQHVLSEFKSSLNGIMMKLVSTYRTLRPPLQPTPAFVDLLTKIQSTLDPFVDYPEFYSQIISILLPLLLRHHATEAELSSHRVERLEASLKRIHQSTNPDDLEIGGSSTDSLNLLQEQLNVNASVLQNQFS